MYQREEQRVIGMSVKVPSMALAGGQRLSGRVGSQGGAGVESVHLARSNSATVAGVVAELLEGDAGRPGVSSAVPPKQAVEPRP